MTGPQHYQKAEALLQERHNCRSVDPTCHFCTHVLVSAQVHATLALAAATVRQRTPTTGSWDEVLR
jgi:hypothetical protein